MASALKALGVPEPASEVFPYAYKHPEGFSGIANDPVWDDDKHLSIGNPDRVVDLKDFGYSDKELAPLATTFGQTSTFSLLSPQGIRDLNTVLDQVEPFAKETPRIRKVLRGGALRSKFLFDLSYSPKILAHVSKIAGCGLVPHPTIMNAAHTNYKPDGSTKSVDKWHTDTVTRIFFGCSVWEVRLSICARTFCHCVAGWCFLRSQSHHKQRNNDRNAHERGRIFSVFL
eukprot:m.133114 g.133114  ORF g.133114 m.133114 type:complete len:229 (-) comp16873_c0_seq3:99-785(-)